MACQADTRLALEQVEIGDDCIGNPSGTVRHMRYHAHFGDWGSSDDFGCAGVDKDFVVVGVVKIGIDVVDWHVGCRPVEFGKAHGPGRLDHTPFLDWLPSLHPSPFPFPASRSVAAAAIPTDAHYTPVLIPVAWH